jgi:hypothetical protein
VPALLALTVLTGVAVSVCFRCEDVLRGAGSRALLTAKARGQCSEGLDLHVRPPLVQCRRNPYGSPMPNSSTVSLIASFAAIVMSVIPGTAQAGPQSIFKMVTGSSSMEKAAQRCSWRGGQRHCASDALRGYREYGFPQDYRTGSRHWWEEMDREGMGGRR